MIPKTHDEIKGWDFIGDVHGCFDELNQFVKILGYPRRDRQLIFLGDYFDRGPDAKRTFDRLEAIKHGNPKTIFIRGNHDHKMLKYLADPAKHRPGRAMSTTIKQLRMAEANGDRDAVERFMKETQIYWENEHLIAIHGAYLSPKSPSVFESAALYGQVDGSRNEHGHPIRSTRWAHEYGGGKTIVVGHQPQNDNAPKIIRSPNNGNVVFTDTKCFGGGSLTAFRYPEWNFAMVPAKEDYWSRVPGD